MFADRVESRTNLPIGKIKNLAAVAETGPEFTAFERAEQEAAKTEAMAKLKEDKITKFISQTQRIAKNIQAERLSAKKKSKEPVADRNKSPNKDTEKPKASFSPSKLVPSAKKNENIKAVSHEDKGEKGNKRKSKAEMPKKENVKTEKPKEEIKKMKSKVKKPLKEQEGKCNVYAAYKEKVEAKPLTPIQEALLGYQKAREGLISKL